MTQPIVVQGGGDSNNSGIGFIIGIILLIVFVFVFITYLLPQIKQSSAPSINVPDKIDVNINGGGQ